MGLAVSEDAVRQHVPGYVSSVVITQDEQLVDALQTLFTWATLTCDQPNYGYILDTFSNFNAINPHVIHLFLKQNFYGFTSYLLTKSEDDNAMD